ncbi:hypothetical protein LguiB_016632 [Lonicera macranthoides]
MAGGGGNAMRAVDRVYNDFIHRRSGIIKALTTVREERFLYRLPNEQWDVRVRAELEPRIPKPVNVNIDRDGIEEKEWLLFVASHSDTWLHALAKSKSRRFTNAQRSQLFKRINALSTIYKVVNGTDEQSVAHSKVFLSGKIQQREPNIVRELAEKLRNEMGALQEESVLIEEHNDDNFCKGCRRERDVRINDNRDDDQLNCRKDIAEKYQSNVIEGMLGRDNA